MNENTEIIPGYHYTGYLVFPKNIYKMPGLYKLGIYNVPSKIDIAANPIEVLNFEFYFDVKLFLDTFSVAWYGKSTLLNTQEIKT